MIKVLGSSSKGNCYLIESGDQVLILECGLRLSEIKKGLDFDFSKVVGCLVSHYHKDHAFAVKDLIDKQAIKVYAPGEVFEKLDIPVGRKAINITGVKCFKIGNFSIVPFKNFHKDYITGEDIECYSYLIHSKELGEMLFSTDTCILNTRPRRAKVMMLECNYSLKLLESDTEDVDGVEGHVVRIIESHMSVETLLKTLEKWKELGSLDETEKIILIHTSNKYGDPEFFKYQVQALTGIQTIIATRGLEI